MKKKTSSETKKEENFFPKTTSEPIMASEINVVIVKKCNSCKHNLPESLDNGICPHCGRRN